MLLLDVLFRAASGAPPEARSPRPPQQPVIAGATLAQWRARMKNLDPNDAAADEAVPGLIALLRNSDVPAVTRRQAALTLGRIGRRAAEAVPVLIELLDASAATADREQGEAEPWAIKALSLFGPAASKAAPRLIALLRDDRRPRAERQAALEALSRIGGAHPDVIPTFIALLDRPARDAPDNARLRTLAVEALGVVGPAAAAAVPALIRACREKDERLRREALRSLGALGARAAPALPTLADVLVFDDSPAVRDVAAEALGKIGPAAMPLLVQLLADRDDEVRWRAAVALGRSGESAKKAAGPLTAALDDEHPLVRITAAESLWRVTGDPDEVVPALLAALTDEDRTIRIRAVRFLTTMGPAAQQAVPRLKELAQDDRAYVRQAAEKTLEKLAAP